ncbi:hypothetical protein CBS101457_002409 [Exobasidium rhododendri]|nr:hypothetical protein CBS101457_002409 [Exobasidium rhododendri]
MSYPPSTSSSSSSSSRAGSRRPGNGNTTPPKRTTITGFNLRDRAIKALDVGVTALSSTAGSDGEPSASSSSLNDPGTPSPSSVARIGRQLRQKSATFVSLASMTPSSASGDESHSSASRAHRGRTLLTDMKNKTRQKSTAPSSLNEGEREAQYRKHNLIPLPPAGHNRPVLLPTYAVKNSEDEVNVRIDGFVEMWPKSVGTSQRVFNQMVRQMANLPRLPRQQPASADTATSTHQTPWLNNADLKTSPLNEDTDDAVFFPDVPYGIPRSASTDRTRAADGIEEEGFTEKLTKQAFKVGSPEKAIGKVLHSVGAIPVDGALNENWETKMQEEAEQERREEERLHDQSNEPNRQGPLGGSPFWSSRTRDDVERLWTTLEHRLRCFWTYRKPYQNVTVEIIPIFEGEQSQKDQEWSMDEYSSREKEKEDVSNLPPLLAMTNLTTDANGVFSTELTISKAKLTHYISHYHASTGRSLSDLMYLRVRACMSSEEEQDGGLIRSDWQSMRVANDESSSVRVISDVDDTARHTEVLGGSRIVTRNVFVRPYEEVQIAGVTHWYDRLCFEGRVDGFHYVTNAPAEMYGIVKAYLSSAQLPCGHLALKHYFSPTKTTSWLQAYLQPAASRKRQNLSRCLDDFPKSKFIFIGDSGEMDLEIYSEMAKERPHQVKGIWIRDVGNVTSTAKSMANTSFASSIPSSIQSPPAAHFQEQRDGDAASKTTSSAAASGAKAIARRSTEIIRKGSLNTGNGTATPLNEFEVRLGKALHNLPPSTRLRFWSTGQDAMDESLEYVKMLKSNAASAEFR